VNVEDEHKPSIHSIPFHLTCCENEEVEKEKEGDDKEEEEEEKRRSRQRRQRRRGIFLSRNQSLDPRGQDSFILFVFSLHDTQCTFTCS
jgi:hypothetical protein